MSLTRSSVNLPTMEPSVSVVIVSDYASGLETGWNDLRATLRVLVQQDFEEPADFILVESGRARTTDSA